MLDKIDYEKFEIFYKEYEDTNRKNKELAWSKEYEDWLVNFTDKQKNLSFCDDDFLYTDAISKEDKENVRVLSYFMDKVRNLRIEQMIIFDKLDFAQKDSYYEEVLIFKLRGNYYKLYEAVGQGTFTMIEKLSFIPKSFVRVDENIPDSLLEELILINDDINVLKNEKLLNGLMDSEYEVLEALSSSEELRFWKTQRKRKFIYLSGEKLKKIDTTNLFSIKEKDEILLISYGIKTNEEIREVLEGVNKL